MGTAIGMRGRQARIVRLVESGASLVEVATVVGLSRTRIHQIYRRAGGTRTFHHGRPALSQDRHAVRVRRFWARFRVVESGCWIWTGARAGDYGHLHWLGRDRYAHGVAYELVNGPVPAGRELDHLCRTPLCGRPDHLEPVTHAENVRRGKVAA